MTPRKASLVTETTIPNTAPFPYADYQATRSAIEQALTQNPFYALLTGASGMGKTTLLRQIARSIDRHRHQIIYLTAAHATVTGIVRVLAMRLHVTPRRSFLENVHLLTEALAVQTSHLVLWLDEADQAPTPLLTELRVLAEADLSAAQTFSLVLCGLPSLAAKLDSPALFPLKRRLAQRFGLLGLRREELEPFLLHRLGSTNQHCWPDNINDELFERTRATPALLDHIVQRAMVLPTTNTGGIHAEHIRDILDQTGL